MSPSDAIFKLIKEDKCPCYKKGDEFRLAGNALLLKLDRENTFITTAIVKIPYGKETCRILVNDLTKILIQHESIDRIPSAAITCSGCTGTVELEATPKSEFLKASPIDERSKNVDMIARLLTNFSIFQSLDRHNLKDIIPFLRLKKYAKNDTILKKGAPAQHLYIILSGSVDVLDEKGVCLSHLRRGDVFGEMSLISGEPVGATIKVVETATIVFISGQNFKEVLNKFPSIQMYLAQLLARRLANANVVRAEEIASGMIGQLSEMPPTELFQTLNINQKTGVLTLTLSKGSAELYFREGDLISASYNKKKGKQAFYDMIKENEGRFKFVPKLPDDLKESPIIGPFMEILLDGLRKADEELAEDSPKAVRK
jgi:CRP/FNR family cyclic AMP-dependent transcriptional regulator